VPAQLAENLCYVYLERWPDCVKILKTTFITATVVLAGMVSNNLAQWQKPVPPCTQKTFAAFKQLPKFEYHCPEGATDYDEAILKLPGRLAAIRDLEKSLETFTNTAWWQANVTDLNACKIHGTAGELTEDEKHNWKSGDYSFDLLGNHQMRLAVAADPCYQTGYGGSSIFLLYYKNGRVFVSKVIDGYYSRVDNSVGLNFANLNGRQIVEVTTANSMPPSLMSYFFEIDPATNKAAAGNLFKQGTQLTNRIYSDMLMGEPSDEGLPRDAAELNIIRNHLLAPSFSAYEENERGKFDANGRKLQRIIYRWNGRFYVRGR